MVITTIDRRSYGGKHYIVRDTTCSISCAALPVVYRARHYLHCISHDTTCTSCIAHDTTCTVLRMTLLALYCVRHYLHRIVHDTTCQYRARNYIYFTPIVQRYNTHYTLHCILDWSVHNNALRLHCTPPYTVQCTLPCNDCTQLPQPVIARGLACRTLITALSSGPRKLPTYHSENSALRGTSTRAA